MNFLRNFRLDQISFWFGFLAGILFAWIWGRLRLALPEIRKYIRDSREAAKARGMSGIDTRFRRETLHRAQSMHLASPLFALDEIIIPPQVLMPPAHIEPGISTIADEDTFTRVIPYIPDWPELTAFLNAPTYKLIDVIQEGQNILLLGNPGCGKTVALAYLASLAARNDPILGHLAGKVPMLIHCSDFKLPINEEKDPIDAVIDILSDYSSLISLPQIPSYIRNTFKSGNALILLDGLDELQKQPLQLLIRFLDLLLKQYPGNRTIAAGSVNYIDGLSKIGFTPVGLACWDRVKIKTFIDQWTKMWTFINELTPQTEEEKQQATDPIFINYWLSKDISIYSPLEVTLNVWASFSGDSTGPKALDAIETYIDRLVPEANDRVKLEKLAYQMINNQNSFVGQASIQETSPELSGPAIPDIPETPGLQPAISNEEPVQDAGEASKVATTEKIKPTRGGLSALIDSGILVKQYGDGLHFIHPVIAGYCAGKYLSQNNSLEIPVNIDWIYSNLTFRYLSAFTDITPTVNTILEKDVPPLFSSQFIISRWLQDGLPGARWKGIVLRRLAEMLQKESIALPIRARCITALVASRDANIPLLLRQSVINSSPHIRRLAVLGYAGLADLKSLEDIIGLLTDQDPNVRISACLALNGIGSLPAIEAVAQTLLQGDETIRQSAAEALATRPSEGYPILQEGATLDDILVRRAVVYGLLHIQEPWAIELLHKLSVEDGQWVVRNAAAQAIEYIEKSRPKLPVVLPPPSESPWLIAYAGKQGTGIPPGSMASDILLLALRNGNEDEKLASIEYLRDQTDPGVIGALYGILYGPAGSLQDAATYALWYMSVTGAEFPSPTEFGLG